MNTKKLLAILLAAIMMLALAACGIIFAVGLANGIVEGTKQ